MIAANYRSGDDFVVEFLGHRFEFNASDFEERVIAAAVKLGLIGSNDLDERRGRGSRGARRGRADRRAAAAASASTSFATGSGCRS